MNPDQKAEYKKLNRQVDEAYRRYLNCRENRYLNLYNNRLERLQTLLRDVGYHDHKTLKLSKLTPKEPV